jgi:hypothetical protein
MKTLLALLLCLALPAFATDKPKPKPAPVLAVQEDTDRREANAYGALAVSGLLTAAFRDKPDGAALAFVSTVVLASAIEAGHSGEFHGSNVGYAALGALVGAVGTCYLYFKRNFVGCGMPFK